MTPKRLVLDTNILLSALLFQSAHAAWLRGLWQSDAVTPLISHDTAKELLRVLSYPKFALAENEREDLLADYLPWCEVVLIPQPPPVVPDCRDPFDKPFLQLALAGKADALITGDKDILALKDRFPVSILTLAELKAVLPQ